MIVLHAIWDSTTSGALYLWAESSHRAASLTASTAKSTKRRDGEQAASRVGTQLRNAHPFVLPPEELREAIANLSGSLIIERASSASLTLRWPSTTKGPLPSPELILEQPPDTRDATFTWWEIAMLQLDTSHALDCLLSLPSLAPHGVAFGSSLRFWMEVASFSSELIARQCFMPALQDTGRGNPPSRRAVWEALLSPEDAGRVRTLARTMPPLCWSFMPPGEKKASLLQEIVQHFLNRTIDAFVRESLSTTSLVPGRRRNQRGLTLPEQWLRALSTDENTLTGSTAELEGFDTTIQHWLDQVQPGLSDAPFRTCFRLDEPQEESPDPSSWNISFHLQANDDPSLLVSAEKVWRERSSTLTFLKRKFENPQERLLADLGKASRLFPGLEASLRSARPQTLPMNTEQAYTFLRETAPLLEDSGFGVLVPPWWQKRSARVGVKLKVSPKSGGGIAAGLMGLNSIVKYDLDVAIGEQTLSADEFENLVNLKMPLVKVRGQWVELRPDQIEAAIAFFKKKQRLREMTLGEALRMGSGQEQSSLGLPVLDIEASGWIKEALDKLTHPAQLATIEVPATFRGQLRPYQLKGVSWLSFLRQHGFGSCLADDMGLGKCVCSNTCIFANGMSINVEDIWELYSRETTFDGQGYWTVPGEQLLVNSLDETTGKMVQARVKHLYRQQVSTSLRKILLEDGSCITITYPHKLLTDKGWTNDLHAGDYVCVPAKLVWEGKPEDRDFVKPDQEIFYRSIKQIEDVQYDGWVYDFEVEKYHNFVANNILCHNTVQLVALLLHDRAHPQNNSKPQHNPTLLICPMSIVGNWQREVLRFAPSLSVLIHHGNERLSGPAFEEAALQHDIVITTYSLALRDKELLAGIAWENIVLDEAQNIKNDTARQTQAIKSLNAQHKIALTGTPVENRLSELWSIMEFLNPGYLGSGSEFRSSFALPIERYHDTERADTLKRLIQPFVLRRLKTDKTIIQDLPDKLEMNVLCNLTQEQASLYEAVVKEMMEKIEDADAEGGGITRQGLVLATLLKLKQVCNHPAHFMGDGSSLPQRSGKLSRLEEMLEEALLAGDKALIFTQFAEMGQLLRSYLQERLDREVLFLHGGVAKKQRDMMVQRFQEERRSAPLFILSLKAGGVGLNLTAANHVFHFDRWWNPAVENQATDRAFRIGQQKNVQVHKFVCVGTLEERIDQMIEEKKALAAGIIGSGENWLTEMSTDQLKTLFALSREAIAE